MHTYGCTMDRGNVDEEEVPGTYTVQTFLFTEKIIDSFRKVFDI